MPIGATSLLMPDYFDQGNQAYGLGKQQAAQSTLAKYAQGAMNGDQGALSQIYAADPQAGMKVQQAAVQAGEQKKQIADSDLQRLAQHSRLITQLYNAGDTDGAQNLYKTIYPEASKILGPNLPGTLDASMIPHMQQLADSVSPVQGVKLSAGETYFRPGSGQAPYTAPVTNIKPRLIQTANGWGWGNPDGSFTPLTQGERQTLSTAGPQGLGQGAPNDPATSTQDPGAARNAKYDAANQTATAMVAAGLPEDKAQAWLIKRHQEIDAASGDTTQITPGPALSPAAAATIGAPVMPPPHSSGVPSGYQRKADGSLEPIPGGPADKSKTTSQGIPGDMTKAGKDYLDSIPDKSIATQAQALLDGRLAFPTGTALKSPYWQQMLSVVAQADPNFDAVNYNSRAATRKAFTSGKEASTVNALNTVAEHIGEFSDKIQALNNTNFQPWNRLKNATADMMGDPRIAAFNTTKKAVADEVAKVWRATGGSQSDIEENLKNLDGAQSTAQLNAAVGELTHLIAGKTAALQDQYTKGMGTAANAKSFVSPGAQKAFGKVLQRAGMETNTEDLPGANTPAASPTTANGNLSRYGF